MQQRFEAFTVLIAKISRSIRRIKACLLYTSPSPRDSH